MTRYLEVEDVLHIIERLGGRAPAVRDGGLLVSALARPRAHFEGTEVYASMGLKAAALLTSLGTGGALDINNLRVAWVATRLFCAANGAPLVASEDEVVTTLRAVAAGGLTLEELAGQLGAWMTPRVV